MNFRIRKIKTYRLVASFLLLLSVGLTAFCLSRIILYWPQNIALDIIALALTASFALVQIVFILKGKTKESHLLDIAFNTDGTINKIFFVFVLVGIALGAGLDAMTIVVILTRTNTLQVLCSMFIIMSIATYLLFNCFIYIIFLLLFKKRELTLEDYSK